MSFNPLLLSDVELTEKIKNRDEYSNPALVELINRFTGIYIKVVSQFRGNPSVNVDDLLEDRPYSIYNSALEYDPKKSSFSTHLWHQTKNLCLRESEDNSKYKFVELKEFNASSNVIKEVENNERMGIIDEEISQMDEKGKNLFQDRCYNVDNIDKPGKWRDIGSSQGMTYEGARLRIKDSRRVLKNKLNKV